MLYCRGKMRLDKYLVVTRLVKQRTRAKEVCDGGHVKAAGKTVKAGDELEITLPRRRMIIRVVAAPEVKSVPKAAAANLYEILSEVNTSSYDRPDDENY
jgi:ribosomal 50S subunit-recycling heat shock protein